MQLLIDAQAAGELGAGRICAVVASRKGVFALERAKSAGIRSLIVERRTFADISAFSRAMEDAIAPFEPELIVHAGFLSIMDEQFCRRFPWQINVHPALIPAFCGKGMYGLRVHQAVLERGVKVSGATVHFVNEIADGGPIILQKSVDVQSDDTPESLQARIMLECEQVLLPRAVRLFCQNRLSVLNGKVYIDEGENK